MTSSHRQGFKEAIQIVKRGFYRGLLYCGLNISKRKCPVELWKWETMDDENVCDDCLQRAALPPMDIAEWMKIGLPTNPEAHTDCGKDCRCRLILYKPEKQPKKVH